jgi:hypothetical protein
MDSKLNVKSALNQILIEPAMILISKNISYLPQWIILSVDMGMVFLWMFRLYLIESYWVGFELNMHFNVIVLLYLTTTIFFFLDICTYSSVIRHSTFNDLIKIFAVIGDFSFLFLLNTGFENFQGQKLF